MISCIINTKNEEANIASCLESITKQSLQNFEIIVVDNNSTDRTKEISHQFTDKVYNKGPERSPQRNFGAKISKGNWLLFIDADMVLEKGILESCLTLVKKDPEIKAVVIPERSYGIGFWAKVKSFEKSLYLFDQHIEAPRFFDKEVFLSIGGYNEKLIASEDWNLADRLGQNATKVGRISTFINHNEGRISLLSSFRKKFYYGTNIKYYFQASLSPKRYTIFRQSYIRNWKKFVLQPHLGLGFLVLKTFETLGGFLGFVSSLTKQK